jgi:hypothetical protein
MDWLSRRLLAFCVAAIPGTAHPATLAPEYEHPGRDRDKSRAAPFNRNNPCYVNQAKPGTVFGN